MDLDLQWVLGLAKNLEQVIIRDEVETWEDLSLGLKIHIKRFLNVLKLKVHVV